MVKRIAFLQFRYSLRILLIIITVFALVTSLLYRERARVLRRVSRSGELIVSQEVPFSAFSSPLKNAIFVSDQRSVARGKLKRLEIDLRRSKCIYVLHIAI